MEYSGTKSTRMKGNSKLGKDSCRIINANIDEYWLWIKKHEKLNLNEFLRILSSLSYHAFKIFFYPPNLRGHLYTAFNFFL